MQTTTAGYRTQEGALCDGAMLCRPERWLTTSCRTIALRLRRRRQTLLVHLRTAARAELAVLAELPLKLNCAQWAAHLMARCRWAGRWARAVAGEEQADRVTVWLSSRQEGDSRLSGPSTFFCLQPKTLGWHGLLIFCLRRRSAPRAVTVVLRPGLAFVCLSQVALGRLACSTLTCTRVAYTIRASAFLLLHCLLLLPAAGAITASLPIRRVELLPGARTRPSALRGLASPRHRTFLVGNLPRAQSVGLPYTLPVQPNKHLSAFPRWQTSHGSARGLTRRRRTLSASRASIAGRAHHHLFAAVVAQEPCPVPRLSEAKMIQRISSPPPRVRLPLQTPRQQPPQQQPPRPE